MKDYRKTKMNAIFEINQLDLNTIEQRLFEQNLLFL